MKQRTITAIVIIAVVLFPVVYGGWPLELLALFVIIAGSYEWLHTLEGYNQWKYFVLPFMILTIVANYFLMQLHIWNKAFYPWFAFTIMILWALPVFTEKVSFKDMTAIVTGYVLFTLCFISFQWLIGSHKYLWTMCFATYGSDTFAYLTGRKFGKHRMNPRISPKKSWEGFAGGVIGGFVLSFVLSSLLWPEISGPLNLALCLLCPIVAELGDLCFSAMKRNYHIKDFSNLLPGHGGLLDRLDSLFANILLFGILYQLFQIALIF